MCGRRLIFVEILLTKYIYLFLRLHNETNCGRHRSWHCIHCGPNLLTADAYNAHMKSEHKLVNQEEDHFIMPTVEVTLNKSTNITATEDIAKQVDLSEDPLLFVVKDEKCYDAVTENARIISDEDMNDISEFLAEETSTEM